MSDALATTEIELFETDDERAARHGAVLRELVDLGLELARAITLAGVERARAGTTAGEDAAASLAQARVIKTVRLCLALEERLRQSRVSAAKAEAPTWGPSAEMADARRRLRRRMWDLAGKDIVREGVERAIEAGASGDAADRLRAELEERLDDEDDLSEFDDCPFEDMVAHVCWRLGLTPVEVETGQPVVASTGSGAQAVRDQAAQVASIAGQLDLQARPPP